ncbi:MAG: SCP2 sterol-binding domain-containing protein [Lachnospiraceae bacterium]|nr:SCP2 sterol-binding domain-containing protein [Lachnospiraceae bacterium]
MAEMVSAREYLENYKKLVDEKAEQLKGMTGTILFDFTEDGNGCWYVEMDDGKAMPVVEGKPEDPTMTITGAYETFYKLRTGQLKPEEVLPTGKLKLGGDTTFTQNFIRVGLT